MFTLLTLGGIVLAAFVALSIALAVVLGFGLAALGLVAVLVKGVLMLVLLPFRLFFGLLLFPFRLARGLLGLLLLPVVLVFGGLIALVALVGGLLTLTMPLLPLAALVVLVWLLGRSKRKPAAA